MPQYTRMAQASRRPPFHADLDRPPRIEPNRETIASLLALWRRRSRIQYCRREASRYGGEFAAGR